MDTDKTLRLENFTPEEIAQLRALLIDTPEETENDRRFREIVEALRVAVPPSDKSTVVHWL